MQATTLTIRLNGTNMLEVGADDMVLVPMDHGERALCREALEGALLLLAQTVVTRPTLATAGETGRAAPRSSPRLVGCPEGGGSSRP